MCVFLFPSLSPLPLTFIHTAHTTLQEKNVMDVMGALEYDPDLPTQQQHRVFLKDSVVFKVKRRRRRWCSSSSSRLHNTSGG